MAFTADDYPSYLTDTEIGSDGASPAEQTADAGCTANSIVDAALTQADDYWIGAKVIFESDTTTAALQDQTAWVVDFDAATDTLTLANDLPATPAAGDTYRLYRPFGGYRSAYQLPGMTVTGLSDVTGVVIADAAYANGAGTGTLSYTNADTSLTWQDGDDSAAGAKVDVGTNGTYTLFSDDADKWLEVTVTAASLPGTDQSDTLTLARPEHTDVGPVTGAMAESGYMRAWCTIEKNESASAFNQVVTYTEKSVSTAAETTLTAAKDKTAGLLSATSLANWPSSHLWVYNSTKNDCAYGKYRSGDQLQLAARNDWMAVSFDAGGGGGSHEISIGDTVSGATSSVSGVVVGIQVDSGTWAGDDAAGTLYLRSLSGGSAFTNDEALNVSATQYATVDGTGTVGLRDLAAADWEIGDTIRLMPAYDIGIEALSSSQATEVDSHSHLPGGVTFSAPESVDDGLSRGDQAASAMYATWRREWIVADSRSRDARPVPIHHRGEA